MEEPTITVDTLSRLGARTLAEILLPRLQRDRDLRRAVTAALQAGDNRRRGGQGAAMIGESSAMRRVLETIRKVAATDAPVLLTGESGTGKELAAQHIHRLSPRHGGPFVPINCAALPPTLIASELFGHEKGAFTGATERRTGRIQAAHGGTVFLDEIGDLPQELQAHLLRFLQEGTVDPVGGTRPVPVDVRVIAATNVPLAEAVRAGRFRQDLYYRLNVVTIELPPLRERGDDLLVLSRHFLTTFAAELGRPAPTLSAEALAAIQAHTWPGNIRELAACMRRAAILAEGPTVGCAELGLLHPHPTNARAPVATAPLEEARQRAEEALLRRAMDLAEGNISRAARSLGISRVTLYRLLDKYRMSRQPP